MLRITVLKSVGLIALCAVSLTACGRTGQPDRTIGTRSVDPAQHSSYQNDRNKDTIDRQAPAIEDRDFIMGRNQNPNIIVGHTAVQNYQVDRKNMVAMAKSVPGVENARITINGGNAYVTLDLSHNVTAGQARQIEQDVITALQQKVPRYNIRVTSDDGVHRANR